MRVFRPIVEATTNLVAFDVADLAHRGGIGGKPVGDDAPRPAIFLHDPLQKLQRRGLVPLRGDHCFQNLAFVIDSPPEIAELAVDLHKDLIQMRAPLGEAVLMRYPPFPDLRREHRAKPVPPKSDRRLMSIPRSARRSSTLRSESGYLTYIITTRQMTSGELLKYRNGLLMTQSLPRSEAPRAFGLTEPSLEIEGGDDQFRRRFQQI